MTEESGDRRRLDSRGDEPKWIPEDPWVRDFIVRLARMIRKTGGKD
jgi:hypothetical protein